MMNRLREPDHQKADSTFVLTLCKEIGTWLKGRKLPECLETVRELYTRHEQLIQAKRPLPWEMSGTSGGRTRRRPTEPETPLKPAREKPDDKSYKRGNRPGRRRFALLGRPRLTPEQRAEVRQLIKEGKRPRDWPSEVIRSLGHRSEPTPPLVSRRKGTARPTATKIA